MPTKKSAAAKASTVDETDQLAEAADAGWGEEPSGADSNSEPENTGDSLPDRLEGEELLAFYASQKAAGRTHQEIAYNAGYITITKDGHERVLMARFNESFLEAQGVEVGAGRPSGVGRSREGATRARVSGQGILLVSQLATRALQALPGAVFTVEYPTGDATGPGAQILLTLTDQIDPVIERKSKRGQAAGAEEQPGTPLLDQTA